jgi:hypothetical protein
LDAGRPLEACAGGYGDGGADGVYIERWPARRFIPHREILEDLVRWLVGGEAPADATGVAGAG